MQFLHLLILAALLFGLNFIVEADQAILEGSLWGISTEIWFMIAVFSPIVHQLYVLVFWRWELHKKGMTKAFGENAFRIFKAGFSILIISRPISIFCLAIANRWTVDLNYPTAIVLSAILFLPGAYTMYSVFNFFGIDNAFGRDHFVPEDYRGKELVKRGMFKYLSNSMYATGFLLLYVPALLFLSKAAILVALFSHLFIWVHYFLVEKPDMNFIYGGSNNDNRREEKG